jgi:hypothetical protein
MPFESGQKETPVPVCRKRPRKGVRGQRNQDAAILPASQTVLHRLHTLLAT